MRVPFRIFCLAIVFGLFTAAATAGSISFRLSLQGARLELVNTGDALAFFPTARLMLADGSWQTLLPVKEQARPTQLAPGERMELQWPDQHAVDQLPAIERLRPTMVRFFDQAGVGFGQISFFAPPPAASPGIAASYERGSLKLSAPRDTAIGATWVLWPQEEGIAAITGPLDSQALQAPARRIEWKPDAQPVSIITGAALPAVTLVHETDQGYRLQRVAAGSPGGRQQRSPWLDGGPLFYALALACAGLALAALLRAQRRRAAG